ncbi:MAG: LysM peptidoglycan-binding domain-containing protein [Hyphomicrobium sp.]|nr:LysM peptidoglycan-binding domain-containing protein [Hyphomicrobium sp.]
MAGRQVDRFNATRSGFLGRGDIAATTVILVATGLFVALTAAPSSAHRPQTDAVRLAQAALVEPTKPAMVPPVRREAPPSDVPAVQPGSAQPSAPLAMPEPPPGYGGVIGAIQDWLARANRDYQGVVIKELSIPAANGTANDAIAKKLEETKAEDARAIAAKRAADELRKATDAKQADDRATKLKAEQARLDTDKRASEKLAAERRAAENAQADAQAKAETEAADRKAREEKRQAAARQAEEARRLADAQRAADARIAEERRRAEAEAVTAARLVEPKPAESKRTIVIIPEPIPEDQGRAAEPAARSAGELERQPEGRANADTSGRRLSGDRERPPLLQSQRGERLVTAAISKRQDVWRTRRGSKVKSWSRRTSLSRSQKVRGGACYGAGRRIAPPGRYIIQRGDSLWRIAKRHYRDGGHYRRIYRANRHIIAHANRVYPCQRVFVPRRKR